MICMKKYFYVGGVVLVILGIFSYFVFNLNSGIISGPDIVTITEGTQSFKNNLSIGVVNVGNGSGIVYISSKTGTTTSKNVKLGDNFDFQNYHIQVLTVKKNTKILPVGWTGGSNGSITLKITEK